MSGPADAPLAVDIFVQDVASLYGADIQLTFDATLAQVIDVDPSASGVQIEPLGSFLKPDFVILKSADNDAGIIRYALTQMHPSEPVTGSGPLARVRLQPQQQGQFTATFAYHMLSDRSGVEIPSSAQDCTITFTGISPDGSPTPTASSEPSITATATPSLTATSTATPTLTPSTTATPSSTPTVGAPSTGTPTITATATQTASATPSMPTVTPSPSPTSTPAPPVTPSPSATSTTDLATPTNTATPDVDPVEVPSATPSMTPEASPAPTATSMSAPGTATISGIVFLDSNRNGKMDPGEGGIAQVLIWVYGLSADSSYYTFTQGDGSYRFADLPTGALYLVLEFDPSGFISTTPNWQLVALPHEMAGQDVFQWFGDWNSGNYGLYFPLAMR